MARGSGDSSPVLRLGKGSFQGVSGAHTQCGAVAAALEVCRHLHLQRAAAEIGVRQRQLEQNWRLSLGPKSA
jgi:hypothetical protein